MVRKRWNELSTSTRRFIVVAGVVEGALKIGALVDLAQRPSSEIRGSKLRWAAAIALTNSVGAVPLAYLFYGRRRPLHRQPASAASRGETFC
jgi:hypothetical protein